MVNLLDLFRPGGGTVDQVMRDAKQPRLPPRQSYMLGGPNMPTEDLGRLDAAPIWRQDAPALPQIPQAAPPVEGVGQPSIDDVMFADAAPGNPSPAPQTPRLPSPISAQPSGGGLPVQPTGGAPAPASAPSQPQALPEQAATSPLDVVPTKEHTAVQQLRAQKEKMLFNMVNTLIKGGPASQVRAMQLLDEIQKDRETTAAETDDYATKSRSLAVIDAMPGDAEDKQRAKGMLQLGAKPEAIQEALQAGKEGVASRKAITDEYVAWRTKQSDEAADLGTMQKAGESAIALIDKGTLATGANPLTSTLAYSASFIPGTDAANLHTALQTMKASVALSKLSELKSQTATGASGLGALNNSEGNWLQSIQGSLDQFQNPEVLKQNIADIIKGKELSLKIRALIPGIRKGDPAANEQLTQLTMERAAIGQQVRNRVSETAGHNQVAPSGDGAYEKKYGLQ